jgi:hypothetical protein
MRSYQQRNRRRCPRLDFATLGDGCRPCLSCGPVSSWRLSARPHRANPLAGMEQYALTYSISFFRAPESAGSQSLSEFTTVVPLPTICSASSDAQTTHLINRNQWHNCRFFHCHGFLHLFFLPLRISPPYISLNLHYVFQ